MSTISCAPTLSAIARKRFQSMTREYADAPAMIELRLVLVREALGRVVVDELGFGIEPVGDDLEPLAATC